MFNIIIVGCGGTGSYLIPVIRYLSYTGLISRVTCIDGDKLEEKNLVRQDYEIKKNKILSLKSTLLVDKLKKINPDAEYKIHSYPDYVYSLEKFLTQDINLIISAVDNNLSRKAHIDSLLETEKNSIFVTPGNEYDFGQVISFAKLGGILYGENPCDCRDSWKNPKDVVVTNDCLAQQYSTPQLITSNVMASTLVLSVITNLIEKRKLITEVRFNLFSLENLVEVIEVIDIPLNL